MTLADLRSAAERATQGPWTTDYRFGEASMVIADDAGRMPLATTAMYPLAQNRPELVEGNAAWIVAAQPSRILPIVEALEEVTATLNAIAIQPDEDDEWHGRDAFRDCRKLARETLAKLQALSQ